MPIEKFQYSSSIEQERLELLSKIVPEAFFDGEINWDILKECLEPHLENESQAIEYFGFTWPGKKEARKLSSLPSKGTLISAINQGVNEDETKNIFVEGENLEVLKIIRKSYANRVKLIYIDPPYNTGNDFVYLDDFSEPLEEYLRKTNQLDDSGNLQTTNPNTSGRFHSNWLTMIYPRLRVARDLLREDGVIFVSIDDNELHHLRIVMNEVFGEENFITHIAWQRKYSVSNNYKGVASIRESIVVYSRSNLFINGFLPRSEESRSRYSNPDNDPRGPWKAVDYWNQASPENRPNLAYPITNPNNGKTIYPEKKAWKYSLETHKNHVKENKIWWGTDGQNTVPALKLFLSEVRDGLIPHNWWPHDEVGNTDEAKKELERLFGVAPFDTPKPTRLIKRILQIANVIGDDIVLDFFAGSGTTAQAVLELNEEDGGNRSFILVQIPEIIESSPFSTIAEVGKERIRRVIKTLENNKNDQLPFHGEVNRDRGFKVFQLQKSNFRIWKDYQGYSVDELQMTFSTFETPLVEGWQEKGLVTEILLIEGFPLDSKVTHQVQFEGNRVLIADSGFVNHRLFICLDDPITTQTVQQLRLLYPEDIFICLDRALTDEAKLQLADTCSIKTI